MFQRKIPISVHMNLLFGPFGAKLIVPIFCFYMLMYVSLFNSLRANRKQTIVAERRFLSCTQYYYKYTFQFKDVNEKRHFCTEWSTTDNDFERRKEASIVYAPHKRSHLDCFTEDPM